MRKAWHGVFRSLYRGPKLLRPPSGTRQGWGCASVSPSAEALPVTLARGGAPRGCVQRLLGTLRCLCVLDGLQLLVFTHLTLAQGHPRDKKRCSVNVECQPLTMGRNSSLFLRSRGRIYSVSAILNLCRERERIGIQISVKPFLGFFPGPHPLATECSFGWCFLPKSQTLALCTCGTGLV